MPLDLSYTHRTSMSSYVPQYVHMPTGCPSYSPPHLPLTVAEDMVPAAPLMVTLPLPSSPTSVSLSNDMDFYPIDISSEPPLIKEAILWETVLTSPIHVHTPDAHIGTIYASFPGQGINALDLVLFLGYLAKKPLGFHNTYIHLAQQLKNEIKAAFYRRRGDLSSTALAWQDFTSGCSTLDGLTGQDLFLGNTSVWGFEQRSIQGYSIVHLA